MRWFLACAVGLFGTLVACSGGTPEESPPADASEDVEETANVDAEADSELPQFDSGADVPAETTVDSGPEVVDTGKIECTGSQKEPNDSLATARPLPGINDCDGKGSNLKGTIGAIDVDFWTFKGTDSAGCSVDPTLTNHSASVRACVFAVCGAGPTEFKKCSKGTAFKLPSGIDGCCTDGPGDASLEYKCTLVGTDDGADVYIRLDSPGASSCLPYDVDYHF